MSTAPWRHTAVEMQVGGSELASSTCLIHCTSKAVQTICVSSKTRISCGRALDMFGCESLYYFAQGFEFTKVCGMVKAYHYRGTNAFHSYHENMTLAIDDVYVDGVSVTCGSSPREHIWTFASAVDETRSSIGSCPSIQTDTESIPPFIGDHQLCTANVI